MMMISNVPRPMYMSLSSWSVRAVYPRRPGDKPAQWVATNPFSGVSERFSSTQRLIPPAIE